MTLLRISSAVKITSIPAVIMSGPGPSSTPSPSPSPAPAPAPAPVDCLLLTLVVDLVSPNPAVVKTLAKDDVLEVSYNGSSLDIITPAGLKAGVVLSGVKRFAECISEGHFYVAVVTEISGAKCRLTLRIK